MLNSYWVRGNMLTVTLNIMLDMLVMICNRSLSRFANILMYNNPFQAKFMISIQTIHIICWKLYVPLHGLHYGRGTKEYHIQMALHMGSIYWIFIYIYPISRLNYFTSFWYNFPNMKYVKKNKCGKEIHSYSCTTIDVFFQISDYLHIVT